MIPTREQVEELLAEFAVGPPGYDAVWDEVTRFNESALHYDPWGEPCSLRAWCRLYEAAVYVPGARELYYFIGDEIVSGYRVSTIWAGGHGGPERLYETRIVGEGGSQEWCYPTRAEAEIGHRTAVETARRLL